MLLPELGMAISAGIPAGVAAPPAGGLSPFAPTWLHDAPEHCSSDAGAPPLATAVLPSPTPRTAWTEEKALNAQVARRSSRVMLMIEFRR